MNIEGLRHRITIQELITTVNDNGFDEKKWIDYKTIWSSMNNLFGKEFYAAKAVNSENTVEFVVRYSKDISTLNAKVYRISWDNRAFNIIFIDNIKYENKWLKIKAIEVI